METTRFRRYLGGKQEGTLPRHVWDKAPGCSGSELESINDCDLSILLREGHLQSFRLSKMHLHFGQRAPVLRASAPTLGTTEKPGKDDLPLTRKYDLGYSRRRLAGVWKGVVVSALERVVTNNTLISLRGNPIPTPFG